MDPRFKLIDISKSSLLVDSKLLNKISHFENQNFPNPWSKEQWLAQLQSNRDYLIFLLMEDDSVVGLTLFDTEDYDGVLVNAYLHKICIQDSLRQNSLAQQLFEFSSSSLLNKFSVHSILLEVHVDNLAAIKFYEKNKFSCLATRKNFYSSGGNAFSMQRVIKLV